MPSRCVNVSTAFSLILCLPLLCFSDKRCDLFQIDQCSVLFPDDVAERMVEGPLSPPSAVEKEKARAEAKERIAEEEERIAKVRYSCMTLPNISFLNRFTGSKGMGAAREGRENAH